MKTAKETVNKTTANRTTQKIQNSKKNKEEKKSISDNSLFSAGRAVGAVC